MTSLVEFLTARLDEDEAVARAATDGPWLAKGASVDGARHQPVVMGGWDSAGSLQDAATYSDAAHIARHDPARALREVDAKREIVKWHESWPVLVETEPTFDPDAGGDDMGSHVMRMSRQVAWLTQREYVKRFGSEPPTAPILRHLAAIYADHPDYRDGWRP
jgi:hypothetical protein